MALGEGAQVPERDGEATGIRRVGDVADRAVLRTAQREQGTLRARRASAARGRGSDLGDQFTVPGTVADDQDHVRPADRFGPCRAHRTTGAERAEFGVDAGAGDGIERGAEGLGQPVGGAQRRNFGAQACQHRHA